MTKLCENCGFPIRNIAGLQKQARNRRKTCSSECAIELSKHKRAVAVIAANKKRQGITYGPNPRADKVAIKEGRRYKAAPYRPKKVATHIMTDAEQSAINQAVDNRYSMPCTTKIYKPGTPEFDAIANQIMPLNRIRKGFCEERNSLLQDSAPDYHRRRNENYSELR